MARTRGADAFSTTISVEMSATTTTAIVASTAGSPPSPTILVIDHDEPTRREFVLFDGTFTGTNFVTSSLANRYRQGSAAGSGIVHPVGAKVIYAALGSHHEEIHDELDAHEASSSVHGAESAAGANTIVRRDASARFRAGTPSNAADVATKGYVDGAIPIGGIIMWSGSVGSIPAGWVLCDGANGTPDLRGRFVIGAGGSYSVGQTGGTAAHTHTSAAHNHFIPTGGAHDHGGGTGGAGFQVEVGAVNEQLVASPNHTHPISQNNGHDHGGSAQSNTPGPTGSTAHLPPHYALCLIMRVS